MEFVLVRNFVHTKRKNNQSRPRPYLARPVPKTEASPTTNTNKSETSQYRKRLQDREKSVSMPVLYRVVESCRSVCAIAITVINSYDCITMLFTSKNQIYMQSISISCPRLDLSRMSEVMGVPLTCATLDLHESLTTKAVGI